MSELTVAASGVRALMAFAVSRGADRVVLLQRSGIDLSELENLDNRVPFSKYVDLMKVAQEVCNDPALALHFGESVDSADISFTPQLGASSLSEVFTLINRYARLVVEVDQDGDDRYVLSRIGGQLWMIDTRRNANDFPELTESGFARMISSAQRLASGMKWVKGVHFTHAAPQYRTEYERIFRVPVTFSSDRNGLLLDDAFLSFKPPAASAYTSQVLMSHAEDLLEKLDKSKSIRAHVEKLLASGLQAGDVRMEAIAKQLGVSRQTLFRRLKSEGVTFEKVLDDLRKRMSLDYLNAKKMSVSQTAHLVGFSDPAAFSRAFKRWTGSSPRPRT